jgi:hypothetical protein
MMAQFLGAYIVGIIGVLILAAGLFLGGYASRQNQGILIFAGLLLIHFDIILIH